MRAKIFFITLAVADLSRSVGFYRDGLGWPTEGIISQEFHDEVTGADGTIALFTLDGGLMLMLYERANLAKDASLPPARPAPPSSAWVSPPHRSRRWTSCSGTPKPPAGH
jgi:catechol 2,3-dioxygenase-like lactoylglutathione lyase family enzyme